MAEQVSHNVVKNSESAGAQASADVAANHNHTSIAGDGHIESTIPKPTTAHIMNSSTTLADGSVEAAAEPSAGEIAASAEKPASESGGLDVGGTTNGVQSGGEENHHVRKDSVKKPTTFSKISVTKNFMAKTSSPGPQAPKLGERPSPLSAAPPTATTTAAKPRLIAKTGAMQSALKPRTGVESAAPDAGTVWNKNRPAPPPPPKQFTDEELKQQYGIHLATRLQSDEGGKESKWADIDEDEEDWAPEAVVWMDGTKSSLTPADPQPVQAPPQKPPSPPPPKPAEAPKPTLTAMRPSESGPPKTILKPGIAAQQARQANGSAAASPSGEKPSLKAKSPAPAPARSPWAALPPIDAISPINPPVQQQTAQPTRLPTQDARAFEQPQPSTVPAREIAADTFDRSWRQGEGTPRELFNSANGRYEPAPEGRRNSRAEPHRKPSLLQRPSHGGPAEPSSAFQSRRRGSSVSQGSLPPGRRMSMNRPEMPPTTERERRTSTVIGHDMRASPSSARNEPARPQFAQQSAWDQQMPPQLEEGEPAEDPVKVQERIMREKREEAKRRREEEEQQREREKQERLKARLAALEGAGKSRREREAEAAAASTAKSPLTEHAPTKLDAPEERSVPSKPAEVSAAAADELEDQTQSSAPDATKVADKMPSPVPPQTKPENQLQQPPEIPERPVASTIVGDQRPAQRAQLSPRAAARAQLGQQPSPYRASNSAFSSPGDRKQQPFGRSPLAGNDAFTGWSSTGTNGNVWGTSGIGNGTFEKASSFAPVPMSQQNLPPPPGMARPSPGSTRISPQGFNRDSRPSSLQKPPTAEQQRAFPPPGIDSRPEAPWSQTRANGVSPAAGLGRQTSLPNPIAPPSRAQAAQQQQQQQQAQQQATGSRDPLTPWSNAASKLPQQYAMDANAADRQQKEGLTAPPNNALLGETFKRTAVDPSTRLGATRRYEKEEYRIHDAQGPRSVAVLSPAPPNTQTQPNGPVPTASPLTGNAWARPPHSQAKTVRLPDGSLNPAHGGMPPPQAPIGTPPQGQIKPPISAHQAPSLKFATGPLPGVPRMSVRSPPPPETITSHPVYSGDARHPRVKLPPPPPRVRLPPSANQTPQSSQAQPAPSVSIPQRPVHVWGPPGAARPIAQTEDWQARFNGLFNRTPIQTEVPPSPPKTPPKAQQAQALAVAASSRGNLDELPASLAATVSLPQPGMLSGQIRQSTSVEGFTIDRSAEATSKPAIEPIFGEELSFGSLPRINVPKNALYDLEGNGQSKYNLLQMGTNSKFYKTVDSQSGIDMTGNRQTLLFFFHKHPQGYFLKIPGTKLSNRLVKAAAAPMHKKESNLDRKSSGKYAERANNKSGKGNGSASASPATNATPTHSRKPSYQQKAPASNGPSPAQTPLAGSSPANAEEPGNKKRHYKGNNRRGGRGHGQGQQQPPAQSQTAAT
ncbi:hypothetical protein KC356_g6517 [Hortaea werneckii]|nr:hypothetical protein KC356_g6517 [Hortaea werneckii]